MPSIGTETGVCQLSFWVEVYGRALAALLPERCQSCGAPAAAGLCTGCRALISRVRDPCAGCGLEQPVGCCPRPHPGWSIATVTAPFHYGPPLDAHIQSMKFRRSRSMGRALGLMLAESLRGHRTAAAVDALAPVPLHRKRLRDRGFNQALEIARPVAAGTGLPVLSGGIGRCTDTRPQTLLEAGNRYANVQGAFEVHRDLHGMDVAIIDDVITTGATVNALAASLRNAGAGKVHAWALARAGPGSPLRSMR